VRLRRGALSTGASPDHLGALVYAVTELTGKRKAEPRIRGFWEPPVSPIMGIMQRWRRAEFCQSLYETGAPCATWMSCRSRPTSTLIE
jgi:hypothetical protein